MTDSEKKDFWKAVAVATVRGYGYSTTVERTTEHACGTADILLAELEKRFPRR